MFPLFSLIQFIPPFQAVRELHGSGLLPPLAHRDALHQPLWHAGADREVHPPHDDWRVHRSHRHDRALGRQVWTTLKATKKIIRATKPMILIGPENLPVPEA
jgi:hypothetical protein